MDEFNNPANASNPVNTDVPPTLGAATIDANRLPEHLDEDTRQWAVILHLSTLLGFLVPILGFVVPFIIWQWKKEPLPGIDPHGKVVANAVFSYLIYGAIAIPLCFLLIGFALLGLLGLLAVIYPIIGALKARDGKVWYYPLCFRFF